MAKKAKKVKPKARKQRFLKKAPRLELLQASPA
jgi:hypothetical protein